MKNIIFVIGAGRSGTTWLQLMLSSHPRIASGQESQFFNNYVSHMVGQWRRELAYPKTDKLRFHGISAYLKESEFFTLIRQFADGIFTRALAEKPTATHFLEKSPNNSFHLDTIMRCYPEAKFIHLIRDGRDVAASIMAAKRSWGKYWHHRNVEDAAHDWKSSVEGALKAKRLKHQYLEVRYESLLDNGEVELRRIFDFLGIETSAAEVRSIIDAHHFDKLKRNQYNRSTLVNPGEVVASGTAGRSEPAEFFRKGIAGDWKQSLRTGQLREFYWVAGDLLASLGYESCNPAPRSKPLSMAMRHSVQRLRSLAGRVVRGVVK